MHPLVEAAVCKMELRKVVNPTTQREHDFNDGIDASIRVLKDVPGKAPVAYLPYDSLRQLQSRPHLHFNVFGKRGKPSDIPLFV
jgi:hypothetical protein